jgi:hypothetical protein
MGVESVGHSHKVQVFVNYSNFGLSDAEEIVGAVMTGDDLAQWAEALNWARGMQGRFASVIRRIASAVVILVVPGILLSLMPIDPHTVMAAAARVRPGMTQDEVVAAVLQCETISIDTYYYKGETKDGRPFSGCIRFNLPPASEVAWGVLEVCDNYGNTLFIHLGAGGVVSAIRLDSPESLQGWQYAVWCLAHR